MDTYSALGIACALAGLLWLMLTVVVLVGRAGHDLRHAAGGGPGMPSARSERRMARRAGSHRTERGRWRRAGALVELGRTGGSRARPPLFRAALTDPDADVRAAAVRALGSLGAHAPWARELLVDALREERAPRSQVAARLEGLPGTADLLPPLLDDERGPVRYWGAMLLARYPGTAEERLEALVHDVDPAVRRAAIESLAERGDRNALHPILRRLDDDVMFVRAHACRAAGRLGGPGVVPRLLPLLGDEAWWVRAAAKDTLAALGPEVAPLLYPILESDDRFARNGAAEVLQDLGVVDDLLRTQPGSPLLHRIFAAGENGLLDAARLRVGVEPEPRADRGVGRDRAAA